MKKRTKAIEDYLEAILIIQNKKEPVQSVKIAALLKVSKPAVAKAMKELLELEYIVKAYYGLISLTESGLAIAKKTYKKHKLIKKFLLNIGVSEKTAEHDCCLIEHDISNETIKKIELFLKENEK